MKKQINKIGSKIKKWQCLAIAIIAQVWYSPVMAQLKISSLEEIKSKAKEGSDAMTDIAKYVIVAAVAIGLLFVVYQIVNNNPKAKEYGLAWVIGVVFVLIGYLVI